jgi:hypothetical protein
MPPLPSLSVAANPGNINREAMSRIIPVSLRIPLLGLVTLTCASGVCSYAAESAPSQIPPAAVRPVDFQVDIQPILAKHCYSCHGPDKQKADLRWDDKAVLSREGEHGPVLVPGNSAQSRVIRLVAGLEPEIVMPLKGERLTSDQIGLLRAWIDQGAKWPETGQAASIDKLNHWAFKTPVRPAVPSVKQLKWLRNPIDNFILAKLEKEKLLPSAEAERQVLIRRLSLDLTGLPPTVNEVHAFVQDGSPDAYEHLVQRLLASPHYGEQWGRHWLDVARYADTNGYEKDKPRSIWPYRDWVINALNRDLHYDQFIVEQLAGDLLPNPTLEQKVATGFLRNSMLNQEGGIEPEQFRVEAMIDRMDAVGKAFLGLTIACSQCHNHKYDPFTQKEYYQLYAFLNNDDEAFLEVPTSKQNELRHSILTQVHTIEDKAIKETPDLATRMAAWEKTLTEPPTSWTVLEPKDWQNFATKFEKHEDFSLLGGGDLQPGGVMRVWAETTLTNITGIRLEALTNANLLYGGPGLVGKGTFLIREFVVDAYPLDNSITNRIKFTRAMADQEARGFPVTKAIDGETDKGGWIPAITPERRNENHSAIFEADKPFGFPGGTRLLITLHQKFDGADKETKVDCHMLGSFRLGATTAAAPLKFDPLSPSQRSVLAIPSDKRSLEQQRELFAAFRHTDLLFTNVNEEIDKSWTNWPYPATTLVLQQRAKPRVTHLFKRGDRLRPGEVVEPDVLSVLHSFPADAPRNRLGLAKWIVDSRSPTTARVIVNRVWQAYFGQGLVATPEDFGTRVEAPSHPELLDWLACELMEPTVKSEVRNSKSEADSTRAWSLKHLHRLILTSATYRQSSKITPDLYEKDQYNRLLARGPRFRLGAEGIQDVALSASGLLNLKMGGPSIYPPIPSSVGDTVYGGFIWPETKGADRYRRGLYTFWKRSLPFPALSAFDMPTGDTACPRRVRSNTPLQALTTLNEKTFVESAQAMALRILKEGGVDDRSRASYAFELCTSRKPNPKELTQLMNFWQEQFDYFENHSSAAVKVAVPNFDQMPEDVNVHKAAAWAMVSRAILNLDETLTKE